MITTNKCSKIQTTLLLGINKQRKKANKSKDSEVRYKNLIMKTLTTSKVKALIKTLELRNHLINSIQIQRRS